MMSPNQYLNGTGSPDLSFRLESGGKFTPGENREALPFSPLPVAIFSLLRQETN